MKIFLTSLAAVFTLVASAGADVVITLTGTEPAGAAVKVGKPTGKQTSATSARFKSNKSVVNGVTESDRDFGQTFMTGAEGFFLDRITTKLGPLPIGEGVFGAEVSVQLFEVSGTARVNDNGTKTGKVAEWCEDPRVDDFMEGEVYTSLGVARLGRLPAFLMPGQLVVLNFVKGDRVRLKPNTQYGFLFMFNSAAPDRALSFETAYWADYAQGHAIRREASGDVVRRSAVEPTTRAGTKSDVFSDMVFWVEGSDAGSATAVVTSGGGDVPLPLPKQ